MHLMVFKIIISWWNECGIYKGNKVQDGIYCCSFQL